MISTCLYTPTLNEVGVWNKPEVSPILEEIDCKVLISFLDYEKQLFLYHECTKAECERIKKYHGYFCGEEGNPYDTEMWELFYNNFGDIKLRTIVGPIINPQEYSLIIHSGVV